MSQISIEKREHPTWKQWIKIKDIPYRAMIGKWQYIVKSDKGEISIVELPNYFHDSKTLWEIYCLKGDLFYDVQRYDTYQEAEDAARVYLER